MAITSNPYGVGESGIDLVTRTPICGCCRLRFAYDTARHTPKIRDRCDHCIDHRPDGSLTDQRDALGEHEPRLREWLRLVTEKANELERRSAHQGDLIADQRRQVAAALQARDRHRDLAAAALSVHGKAPGAVASAGYQTRVRPSAPSTPSTTVEFETFGRTSLATSTSTRDGP